MMNKTVFQRRKTKDGKTAKTTASFYYRIFNVDSEENGPKIQRALQVENKGKSEK